MTCWRRSWHETRAGKSQTSPVTHTHPSLHFTLQSSYLQHGLPPVFLNTGFWAHQSSCAFHAPCRAQQLLPRPAGGDTSKCSRSNFLASLCSITRKTLLRSSQLNCLPKQPKFVLYEVDMTNLPNATPSLFALSSHCSLPCHDAGLALAMLCHPQKRQPLKWQPLLF
jgi:hypothetical protein